MQDETGMKAAFRMVEKLRYAALVLCFVAVLLLVAAIFWPVNNSMAIDDNLAVAGFRPVTRIDRDLDALMQATAGKDLIRPAEAQAAVKDSGAAARMLKQLDLQGVVQMQDRLVAYIKVENVGVRRVADGDTILEFLVKEVVPGKVKLTLEGVEVSLY